MGRTGLIAAFQSAASKQKHLRDNDNPATRFPARAGLSMKNATMTNAVFATKPEAVAILDVRDKAGILEALAQLFAEAWDIDAQTVAEYLEEREKLGSTGFGRGVAIPHARVPGIARPIAALVKLDQSCDFDAADGMPVELVFGLLSPESSGAAHLHALAAISRLVRDENVRNALADAPDEEALYALLTNVVDRDAA